MSLIKQKGRPRRRENEATIRLYKSTIERWNLLKSKCQLTKNTHNEFAMYLLDLFDQQQPHVPKSTILDSHVGKEDSSSEFSSSEIGTPIPQMYLRSASKRKHSTPQIKSFDILKSSKNSSSIRQCSSNSLNVTGVYGMSEYNETTQTALETENISHRTSENELATPDHSSQNSTETAMEIEDDTFFNTSRIGRCLNHNKAYSTIPGDPPSSTEESEESSDSDSSEDETWSDDSDADENVSVMIDHGFNENQVNELVDILKEKKLRSDCYEADFVVEELLTLNPENKESSFMDVESEKSRIDPKIDANFDGNLEEIKGKLEKGFESLYSKELKYSSNSQKRYFVSENKLLELRGTICGHENENGRCLEKISFSNDYRGPVLIITWTCPNKHNGKWVSDTLLCTKRSANVYMLDVLLPTAVLFSGNNFTKMKLFADFFNLSFISQNTFHRIQKLYCAPVLSSAWNEMKDIISRIFKDYSNICLCGDGRNDSPGHSARYCVYTLMEHFLSIIVDFEVVDKRETAGVSNNMECEGLRRLLIKLLDNIPISEITTDASSTVQKLIANMKVTHEVYKNLFHSLDVWHTAKNLSKKLNKVAAIKGNDLLLKWIPSIINHFWYSVTSCSGSTDTLKNTWFGVLHHVCGEHEWATSACKHGPLVDDEPEEYIPKDHACLEALREKVLDQRLVSSLNYYIRARHTGNLESFNGMLTKYTPKRNSFGYEYFIARTILAALDHNHHIFRGNAVSKDGSTLYHRKFSKRSKNYSVQPVKTPKRYAYINKLIDDVLDMRVNDQEPLSRVVPLPPNHPVLLSPTLAIGNPPPRTKILVKEQESRKASSQ